MTSRRLLTVLALAVLLAHAPFLPPSLEDTDSVNFALGVRRFDVAQHRPHPPGYPIYIAAGKVAVAAIGSVWTPPSRATLEARALSVLSLLSALAVVLLLYRVFACLRPIDAVSRAASDSESGGSGSGSGEGSPFGNLDTAAMAATTLAVCAPLLWYLAVRPMSDLPGIAAVLAAQACLLLAWWRQSPPADGDRRLTPAATAASGRMIVAGALLAGLAIGVRVQTGYLTAPLLMLVLIDRIGRGVAGALMGSVMSFALGCLAWAVPLVVASGGLGAYLAALGSQMGEDFAGGEMLYLTLSPRAAAFALQHTFVDPWDAVPLAVVVLLLAALGVGHLLWRDRRTLLAVTAMSVPYLLFHLLYQDTSFIRYAAPLVPVVAVLAVKGAALAGERAMLMATAVLSLWSVIVATPVLVAYGRDASPATRVVEAMNIEARTAPPAALAMHQSYQRPLEAEDVAVQPVLPSPPRLEWLELASFWKRGTVAPVWFLADPRRTDLALIDPLARRDATRIGWIPAASPAFGGVRPNAVQWLRMPAPGWFAETGWALTPETAGMARLMGRGPHLGPITAWVRRRPGAVRVVIGGRHLGAAADPAVRFTVTLDGAEVAGWEAPPGFFLHTIDVPAGALTGSGELAELTVQSRAVSGAAVVPTAIEQFDLQASDALMWGFTEGWQETEYTPALGLWRWTSERAALRVFGAARDIRVTLTAESPARYFDAPVRVRALAGDREVAATTLGPSGEWSFVVPIDALQQSDGIVAIETDRTFVPAERGGGNDRRRLGLRVFTAEVIYTGLR